MMYRNLGLKAEGIVKAASSAIAVLGLLALAGCSSSVPPPDPVPAPELAQYTPPTLDQTEVHLYLDQCKQLEAGLYKCPAFEKDICNPEYNGQAQCVRIGRKGSVFVRNNPDN